MNLHAIVAPYTATVNPLTQYLLYKSTGYTTSPDGSQVPNYAAPVTMYGDEQALQYNDIAQIGGLNVQGERRAIYLNGNWEGVVQPDGTGGDLLKKVSDGTIWLVVFVFENWADRDGWVKVAATRQMNGTSPP